MKIRTKILIPVVTSMVLIAVSAIFGISAVVRSLVDAQLNEFHSLFENTIKELVDENVTVARASIDTVAKKALEEASFFSQLPFVQEAYRIAEGGNIDDAQSPESQEARDLIREDVRPMVEGFLAQTGEQRLKLHFHLPNGRSLVRVWRNGYQTTVDGKKVDISDDISPFRKTVTLINSGNHTPITGIEIGRGGFAIRGLSPVVGPSGEHLGSDEVLFPFSAIFAIAKTSDKIHYAVYMDAEQLTIAKSLRDPKTYPVLGEKYVLTDVTDEKIATQFVTAEFLDQGREAVVSAKQGSVMTSAIPIEDFSGTTVGVMMMTLDISDQNAMFLSIEQKIEEKQRRMTTGIGAGFIALIALLTLVLGITVNRLVRPLSGLTEYAETIAAGDFELDQIKTRSKDEVGRLAGAFGHMIVTLKEKSEVINRIAGNDLTGEVSLASEQDKLGEALQTMQGSLREALLRVHDAVDDLSSGSDQISLASESLSQGATEQASNLEEISSSLNQVTHQADENARNATDANELAKEVSRKAVAGNDQMSALTDAMGAIALSSEGIRKIVKVIDNIAFQINLLALNANVEAARAGKYGKGFAVVADEVRNLATRSAEAVQETTAMVETSVSSIDSGNKAVEQTAGRLSEIIDGVSGVADHLANIAASSGDQAADIEHITRALEQVEQVTQANTANAEESSAASVALASQAQDLRKLVGTFTLEQQEFNFEPQS